MIRHARRCDCTWEEQTGEIPETGHALPVPSHLDRILDACSGVELDTGVHKRGRGACSHNKVTTQLEYSQSHTATMLQQPHCYHRVSGARVLSVAQLRHDASLRERSCCGKAPVRPGTTGTTLSPQGKYAQSLLAPTSVSEVMTLPLYTARVVSSGVLPPAKDPCVVTCSHARTTAQLEIQP